MADPRNAEVVKPYNGDPFIGNLETPINSSPLVKAFINNLPAYRRNVAPLVRGIEIGLAHGYFIVHPWVLFGPVRETEVGNIAALLSAVGLILIATAGMSLYGIVSFQTGGEFEIQNPQATPDLKTAEGWSQLTGGFFIGAMGGAFVSYFLLENFGVLDSIFRGLVHNT